MLYALGKTLAAAIEKSGGGGRGGGGGRRGLEERHFRRIEKFDGRGSWSDWSFTMKVATWSADKEVVETMDWIESVQTPKIDNLENHAVDTGGDSNGTEFFAMLVGLTPGEALIIVRGTEGMNGYMSGSRPTRPPRHCP